MSDMSENQYWISFWIIVAVIIASVSAAIGFTNAHNTSAEAEAMVKMVQAGANPIVVKCAMNPPYNSPGVANLCSEALKKEGK